MHLEVTTQNPKKKLVNLFINSGFIFCITFSLLFFNSLISGIPAQAQTPVSSTPNNPSTTTNPIQIGGGGSAQQGNTPQVGENPSTQLNSANVGTPTETVRSGGLESSTFFTLTAIFLASIYFTYLINSGKKQLHTHEKKLHK